MTTRQRTPAGEPTPEPETGPDTPSGASSAQGPEEDLMARAVGAEDSDRSTRANLRDALTDLAPRSRTNLLGQEVPWPLSVGEAIAEVTRRVPAIAKEHRASQGGSYSYRGIDDVLEALHPILADVGLVILPGRVVREQWETRSTGSGGTLNVARLLVRYTFVGPDGSELRAEVWGEGGDSGDKATQKAHSQSYKTLCFQAFSIPTQGSAADEPDATNPPARPFTLAEQERAQAAWQAARDADTVEKLAGVRRRALALLNVPLLLPGDSSLVPLSVLFDRRLAELDRTAGEPA